MVIIIDEKMSPEAKAILASYGDLLELKTEGITYPAISGHPDIFFCQSPGKLIVAPNLPQQYFDQLNQLNIGFIRGELPVGPEYPSSAHYNAVATSTYLIHNFRHTDFIITRTLDDLQPVHVDQGYCRCNLLPLKDDHFITSDEGIFKVLSRWSPSPIGPSLSTKRDSISSKTGLHLLGLNPEGILLEGFPYGFFGGCCGVWDDKVFINGSLKAFNEGEKVRKFLEDLGYEIVELTDGELVDVGSILFIEK